MQLHFKYVNAKLFALLLFGIMISCNFSCTDNNKNEPIKDDTIAPEPKVESIVLNNNIDSNGLTDSRDGEVYTIVKIGEQIWMAENLRYNAKDSWLNPNNPSDKYGRLYDGMTAQEICPDGWHLPSDAEWNQLERTLGMLGLDNNKVGWRGKHGQKMKSNNGWEEGMGSNSSGFNALPAGFYNIESGFEGLGYSTGYWSSSENGIAWMRWLGAPLESVNRYSDDIIEGIATASCRCIKN